MPRSKLITALNEMPNFAFQVIADLHQSGIHKQNAEDGFYQVILTEVARNKLHHWAAMINANPIGNQLDVHGIVKNNITQQERTISYLYNNFSMKRNILKFKIFAVYSDGESRQM